MQPSSFYGRRTRSQNVSVPGPSHEESSDDISADDVDSSFNEMDSSSSCTDTMDDIVDTADDEPTEDNNDDANDNMGDSNDSWDDVCASQRLYPFTGKEELLIKLHLNRF